METDHHTLHASIMGKTGSALLTFETEYVPFYVKVGSELIRCRPTRVPHYRPPKVYGLRTTKPTTKSLVRPVVPAVTLPHITAGKDCLRRFLPQLPARKPNMQGPNQVSWSAIAARAPDAQSPPANTNPFPPLQPTTIPLPLLKTVLPPPAFLKMLSTLQEQNAQLLARVKALKAKCSPPPPPVLPAPSVTITTVQIEAIVDTRLTAIIDVRLRDYDLPQVQQMNQQGTTQISKMITDATETLLRNFNERIEHLERVMNPGNPP